MDPPVSGNRRVLVVDDDRRLAELIRDYLTPLGYQIELRHNGPEGLEEALAGSYEAMILDVMMPGMDGPSTFRELRKNPATAKIPVLLLTAKVQSSDQRRFADLGVESVLFKPFDPMTLADQIAGALGWK